MFTMENAAVLGLGASPDARRFTIGIFRGPLFRGPLIISLCPYSAFFSKMSI